MRVRGHRPNLAGQIVVEGLRVSCVALAGRLRCVYLQLRDLAAGDTGQIWPVDHIVEFCLVRLLKPGVLLRAGWLALVLPWVCE